MANFRVATDLAVSRQSNDSVLPELIQSLPHWSCFIMDLSRLLDTELLLLQRRYRDLKIRVTRKRYQAATPSCELSY